MAVSNSDVRSDCIRCITLLPTHHRYRPSVGDERPTDGPVPVCVYVGPPAPPPALRTMEVQFSERYFLDTTLCTDPCRGCTPSLCSSTNRHNSHFFSFQFSLASELLKTGGARDFLKTEWPQGLVPLSPNPHPCPPPRPWGNRAF